jgi:hypothetical protein
MQIIDIFSVCWGIMVSVVQFLGTAYLGIQIVQRLSVSCGTYLLHVGFGIGAALLSITVTLLSILGLINDIAILLLWAIIIYFFAAGCLTELRSKYFILFNRFQISQLKLLINRTTIPSTILILCFIYIGLYCISGFRGADIGIYHLAIPRSIVWDKGFVYNDMFFGAGLPSGWHHYGVLSFYVGNEVAYLCLSLICSIGLIDLGGKLFNALTGSANNAGVVLSKLFTAFVAAAMLGGSVPNNDIPSVYLELALFLHVLLAQQQKSNVKRANAILVGLVSGFILSVKLTTLVGVVCIMMIFIYRQKSNRLGLFMLASISAAFGTLVWPVLSLINSGSPLPLMLNGIRFFGTALPHLEQSLKAIELIHGNWYTGNAHRIFSLSWLPIPLAILGLLFLPVIWKHKDFNRILIICLLGYALLRYLLVITLSPRLDIIFHDRYHLISYVSLIIIGLYCWLFAYKFLVPNLSFISFIAPSIIGLFIFTSMSSSYEMILPNDTKSKQNVPSMISQIKFEFKRMLRAPDWQSSSVISYIRTNTSMDAVIATNQMAAYDLDRRFVQILPVAQNSIDLRLSPDEIITLLKARKVEYIYITPSPGFVAGVDSEIETYLTKITNLANSNLVEVLSVRELSPGVFEKFMKIK